MYMVSGEWLLTDSLVCHPSWLNCAQRSHTTRPGRAQETVMEGMC